MSSGVLDRAALHAQIARHLETERQANPVSYNLHAEPYQAYERIGFPGSRWSVEKRIKAYGLDRFFDPRLRVLDIGSNTGFFVVEFALHCALAHGVEPTPDLNRIGQITAEHLGVADKVRFFDGAFDAFEAESSYDLVLSLAAFFTFDGRERSQAESYFSKVARLLAPGGALFYESTSHTLGDELPGKAFRLASEQAERAISGTLYVERSWTEETRPGSGSFRRYVLARRMS